MTMTLELTPEVQAGLLAQAQENGMSLEAFAELVLREKSRAGQRTEISQVQPVYQRSSEEWLREFIAWVNSHAGNAIVLPDEAV